MARYAEGTHVPVQKSRQEIEATVQRFGATAFAYGMEGNTAHVGFEVAGRRIRFTMALPGRDEHRFRFVPVRGASGPYDRRRTVAQQNEAWELAVREHWRALAMVIKAKLAAVQAGITTVEDEFLAWTVMPDGRTVSEHAQPAIAQALATGTVPALLPGPSNGAK